MAIDLIDSKTVSDNCQTSNGFLGEVGTSESDQLHTFFRCRIRLIVTREKSFDK